MKLEQKSNKLGMVWYIPKRDKWYEWFRIEIEEGMRWRFYFPIKKSYLKATTICWIWYLIPFVLMIELTKEFIFGMYKFTRELLDMWRKQNK